ncbi:MAG: GNAT family N-acetyltransferase [Bacteroidaceae bacterium]|nr:GNAT family N-acetyltransferase [Bacteroidaceae bacterium]
MRDTLLQSPTVRLRAMENTDLPLIYRLENDSRMWDTTSTVQPLSRSTISRFIKGTTGDIYEDRQLRLVIEIGVRSEELGVRSEELGVKSEELGVKSEELGVKSEELGVKSEELGVKSKELGVSKPQTSMPKASRRLSSAVGEAGADTERKSESEAAMPKASRRLSSAVGEAGADTERKSESEAANLQPQTSTSVGFIDLTDFSPRHLRAEVGICLLPEYQSQRIGTEALRLVEEYAAQMLHIHQLYAYINPSNIISQRLFSSAGYQLAGMLHDWVKTPDGYESIEIRQKKIEKKV